MVIDLNFVFLILKVSYGSDGLDTTMVKENVAMVYVVKGQHEEAIPYFNQAGRDIMMKTGELYEQ